nr:hypothetical protein [Burkholderia anthina]
MPTQAIRLRGIDRERLERILDSGRNRDDPLGRIVQIFDTFLAREFGIRQQKRGLFQVIDFPVIVARRDRMRIEVTLRMNERNEVVQSHGDRGGPIELPDARHTVPRDPLEQAADVNDVRLQARQERFPAQLGDLATCDVVVADFLDRPHGLPDTDVLLRQQPLEFRPNRIDGIGHHAAQRQNDLVLAAHARDALRKTQYVAADSAESAFCLRTLHVDNNAHQFFSCFSRSNSATRLA